MTVFLRNLALLAVAVLALAGCGVDNLDGVDLATAAIQATSTPQPTATPDPLAASLPNTITKDFLGTTITLNYPDDWQTGESGQSMTVFSADADGQGTGFGLNAFVSLTRRLNLEAGTENLASIAMLAFVQEAADGGFMLADSVPNMEQTHAFTWGEHEAAIFAWDAAEYDIAGIELVVLDSQQRRFVLFSAQSSVETWLQFTPTLKAMLSTVVLDGDMLPGADLLAAFDTVAG